MADYSWVVINFDSKDPAIVARVVELWGNPEQVDDEAILPDTSIQGETAYGLIEEVESYLIEQGIAYSRYSDGKYEYDGDEAHWRPGMESPRVFTRLNNGGRTLAVQDLPLDGSDEELAAFVREFASFDTL